MLILNYYCYLIIIQLIIKMELLEFNFDNSELETEHKYQVIVVNVWNKF